VAAPAGMPLRPACAAQAAAAKRETQLVDRLLEQVSGCAVGSIERERWQGPAETAVMAALCIATPLRACVRSSCARVADARGGWRVITRSKN
jgi:hypothetical protein